MLGVSTVGIVYAAFARLWWMKCAVEESREAISAARAVRERLTWPKLAREGAGTMERMVDPQHPER
jgi:hypothetical protein